MLESSPHIMTVDVEDWFHILEFDGGYTRDDWSQLESRVSKNTERLLDLFDETGTKATFFVVGWIAERFPDLVRRIAEAGHELASHSYWHEVIPRHDRRSLGADLERSKGLLEEISGAPVAGFRAPGGSITPECAWAFDVILEQGFSYDSSIWPAMSSHGGFATPFSGPHSLRTASGELTEIPASTLRIGGMRLPYAGGGFLRLFPYRLIRAAIVQNVRQGDPTTVYVHPRDLDRDQPRMSLPRRRYFKYYVGLASTESKLRALLSNFRFVPAATWIAEHATGLRERMLDVREVAAGHPRPDPRLVPPPPP